MNPKPERFRLQLILGLAGLGAAGLLLAGCKGIPTKTEKQSRADVKAVTEVYRPGERKATLPTLDTNATVGTFLTYAMLNQPRVEAAYYDYAAAVERITVERSLPDPRLSFESDIADIAMTVMPGLMQEFPGPGKLKAAANVATAESRTKYFAFETSVLQTAFSLKRAYYQLWFWDENIRINRQTLDLLTELSEIARSQNSAGKVTLQDVYRAQIEQDQLTTEIENLEDSRRPLNAQLKGALGLQDDTSACGVCGKNVQGDRGFAKINHGGIMVNLCCPHCLETFKKDPGPHMARLAKIEAYRVFKGMKE